MLSSEVTNQTELKNLDYHQFYSCLRGLTQAVQLANKMKEDVTIGNEEPLFEGMIVYMQNPNTSTIIYKKGIL